MAQSGSNEDATRPSMDRRGDSGKLRVVFVCIGNSCRSPMAEGLARSYGSDVMIAESAGLMPIGRVDPLSIQTMRDRNIDISSVIPKRLDAVNGPGLDLIVNMSGWGLPPVAAHVEEWNVPDPLGQGDEAFRKTADLLEQLVMRLILQLRLNQHPALDKARFS